MQILAKPRKAAATLIHTCNFYIWHAYPCGGLTQKWATQKLHDRNRSEFVLHANQHITTVLLIPRQSRAHHLLWSARKTAKKKRSFKQDEPGQQDSSRGTGAWRQVWLSEFRSWNPHGRRREPLELSWLQPHHISRCDKQGAQSSPQTDCHPAIWMSTQALIPECFSTATVAHRWLWIRNQVIKGCIFNNCCSHWNFLCY